MKNSGSNILLISEFQAEHPLEILNIVEGIIMQIIILS